MFLDFSFEIRSVAISICFFYGEVKFKTLINRSPLNRPEVTACARTQENRKFFAAQKYKICCLFE